MDNKYFYNLILKKYYKNFTFIKFSISQNYKKEYFKIKKLLSKKLKLLPSEYLELSFKYFLILINFFKLFF